MGKKSLIFCLFAGALVAGPGTYYLWRGSLPGLEGPRSPESQAKEDDARRKLAFVSLTDRLPTGRPIPLPAPFSKAAASRWEALDTRIEQDHSQRAVLLRALHERTKAFFVESPGEGAGRTIKVPDEQILLGSWLPDRPLAQFGSPADFPLSPGEMLVPRAADEPFYEFHLQIAYSFVNPGALGYVKDRQHVAGFRSHTLGFFDPELGKVAKAWRMDHVLLIGILMADRPRVYLSDHMPSMEQARKGKTRSLDFFEEAGLSALRGGEDLFIVQRDDTLRMLGALRATTQCLQCHDANHGDLLGAFSYTLREASPKPSDP